MLHLLHKIVAALNAAQSKLVEHGIRRAYNLHAKADAVFRRNIEFAKEIEESARRMRNRASEDLTAAVQSADEHLHKLYAAKGEQYSGMIRDNVREEC